MTREARMKIGAAKLCEGMFVLGLSLLMWRMTRSVPAWAALCVPGSLLIATGVRLITR